MYEIRKKFYFRIKARQINNSVYLKNGHFLQKHNIRFRSFSSETKITARTIIFLSKKKPLFPFRRDVRRLRVFHVL